MKPFLLSTDVDVATIDKDAFDTFNTHDETNREGLKHGTNDKSS